MKLSGIIPVIILIYFELSENRSCDFVAVLDFFWKSHKFLGCGHLETTRTCFQASCQLKWMFLGKNRSSKIATSFAKLHIGLWENQKCVVMMPNSTYWALIATVCALGTLFLTVKCFNGPILSCVQHLFVIFSSLQMFVWVPMSWLFLVVCLKIQIGSRWLSPGNHGEQNKQSECLLQWDQAKDLKQLQRNFFYRQKSSWWPCLLFLYCSIVWARSSLFKPICCNL